MAPKTRRSSTCRTARSGNRWDIGIAIAIFMRHASRSTRAARVDLDAWRIKIAIAIPISHLLPDLAVLQVEDRLVFGAIELALDAGSDDHGSPHIEIGRASC